ncbi:MAG: Methionine aminopeptidase [Alphaproteobacteria bacterium MarineAlpha6_Bin3]|nr:MAG: Methionine aminopeptidase [Alphaproteobacteria bacterium MarineAlpha6_Bin3]
MTNIEIKSNSKKEKINIYTKLNFSSMKTAGRLAAETLDYITKYVKPGVTTDELNKLCHDFIIDNNAIPAPLNYNGYPKSICTSVNHVVCHGIPSKKILDSGDIINIDVTVILDGWHGDTSRMFVIGDKTSVKANKLIKTTYDCMMDSIKQIKPGLTLGDIGYIIEKKANENGFTVVKDFCGHGIGRGFHEPPSVLHYGSKGEGLKLKEGMIFTIEPMLNAGTSEIKILDDGWTAITKDRKLSAQFEHTIGVTKNGYEIFTLSPKNYHKPPY